MEQEAVFHLGSFDERDINLNEPPRDALHYLQQVAVSRARCPEVVTAPVDNSDIKGTQLITNNNLTFTCKNPSEWSLKKSNEFSAQRSRIDVLRKKCKKLPITKWPSTNDACGWRNFCLQQRSRAVVIEPEHVEQFAHHSGNPPTLRLVLSLTENQVNCIIEHLIEKFVSDGYTRAIFEWIYALLLVLQKPLLHDVCSSLRELVKYARILRETLPEPKPNDSTAEQIANKPIELNAPTRQQLSLFIAIVGVYFEQKDLADQC